MTTSALDVPPLLEVRGLRRWFPVTRGVLARRVGDVKAVDGVDLVIPRGRTVGLVGESGCGKTTVGRALLRLVEPTAGEALYRPAPDDVPEDLFRLSRRALRARRRELQIVFQDPIASLNPRLSVGQIVGEPLGVHGLARGARREERVRALFAEVGLRSEVVNRFPHEFSGGERQRIGIARALASRPRFVVCDEAVSALDVSVQAQILNLLWDLQERFGLSYLFIAHDLSVVKYIAHSIAVMYLGRIVEHGSAQELFAAPAHPYTRALLAAAPAPRPRARRERAVAGRGAGQTLSGEVPSPLSPPSGCHFRTRCPVAEERCERSYPAPVQLSPTHSAACHLLKQ